MEEPKVPPTTHLERLDPEGRIDIPTQRTPVRMTLALPQPMGIGGRNAALVVAGA
ncbi:hypothetical protein [Streptomyces beigongshangae]|uniref:hypothetical protein n=1 Tax=Streptomyces beigongshangae TaxID=2841597 RepID=UPI001C84960D|nr:hypothetical protein [Streptomyces sp. REN17]